MVHYDVQLMGGIQLHLGKIAEMATGEGKTLVATLPLYLNALAGTRRAPRHGQLVPRPPRLAVDGARVHVPRPHGRVHRRHRAGHAGASRGVPVRHHVRHEQRIRLRLPARQHGDLARPARAASALVRDRRRSRLGAHRRGAHAAHHLGPGRQRERRAVLRAQRGRRAPRARADGDREPAGRRGGAGARGEDDAETRRCRSTRRS